MRGLSTIKRTLRGETHPSTAALEAVRRMNVRLQQRRERRQLEQLNRPPARLTPEFASRSAGDLLAHFRQRESPRFFPGFVHAAKSGRLQSEIFPEQTQQLLASAERITRAHCWPLLGLGEKCFGADEIDWNRDPLSGFEWPLDYHGDISLFRGDDSDARVLWEVNRLAHLITLGRAYAVTKNETLATEFLKQVRSWRSQNPVARGANWACAMEVSLRAMNLLAAFFLFLSSPQFDEDFLAELLMMFDQHGAHIRRNLEYSHFATSNHYMCDVTGLLWLGLMLPELAEARPWREFGLRELLNELDKQILPDGADSESSTGYHRLKLELLLYSFLLCRENGIEMEQKSWRKLRAMADYTRAYLRPDGYAPLIGDSDSGQVLPIVKRTADDHLYLLTLAAAFFEAPELKPPTTICEEILWILGEQRLRRYELLPAAAQFKSKAFKDAGVYILREDDLYLLFNASDCGLHGRGSHGHNDALSIEVSAAGTAFIIDPGSYVYTADLHQRHLFRSTAYHSTVQVDGFEQNTTDQQMPFVIGDEAYPRVLIWETNADFDQVVAEHDGYQRLAQPVTLRRAVRFEKSARYWLVEDSVSGVGAHDFVFRFHCAPGLEVSVTDNAILQLCDKISGARLFVASLADGARPELEPGFASTDYGAKQASVFAGWSERASVPLLRRWAMVPLRADEGDVSANQLIATLRSGAAPLKS